MFRISEQPSGTAAAGARDARPAFSTWRCRWAMFSVVDPSVRRHESGQHAVLGQQVDVPAHRLQRHAELAREFVDRQACVRTSSSRAVWRGLSVMPGILVQTETKTNDARSIVLCSFLS
jgi:hypothetical protein